MPIVKCEFCGKEFKRFSCRINKFKHSFCSRECVANNQIKSIEKKVLFNVKKLSNGCWIWNGSLTEFGYGQVFHNRKMYRAHRLSWIIHNGEIPKGILICHICDVRSCINPQHLFMARHQGNMDDMVKKGRQSKGENQSFSKLTEKQVKEIRTINKIDKYSYIDLAKQYKVSRTTIYNIVNLKAWKHI